MMPGYGKLMRDIGAVLVLKLLLLTALWYVFVRDQRVVVDADRAAAAVIAARSALAPAGVPLLVPERRGRHDQ